MDVKYTDKVRQRTRHVKYIFSDETYMISPDQLLFIPSKLAELRDCPG